MAFVELETGLVFETSHPEWHNGGKVISKAQAKLKQKEFAIKQLKSSLKIGDTVYCVMRHVSASGMSRRIDFYKIENNRPQFLTGWIAHALGYRWTNKAGLIVNGCGMDMGFHVVYSVSRTLFPEGFKDGQDSQKDGGYALRHEWL